MDSFDNAFMSFNYNGYGLSLSKQLDDGDAEYLPKVLQAFAEFLRASGFVYVSATVNDDGDVVFGKDYPYRSETVEDDAWADEMDMVADDYVTLKNAEDALYTVPGDYWDACVDAVAATPVRVPHSFKPGDIVKHTGLGTPELIGGSGYGGHRGVSLIGKIGVVVDSKDAVVDADRVLVRWFDWEDGHEGVAFNGSKNHWFLQADNLVKLN